MELRGVDRARTLEVESIRFSVRQAEDGALLLGGPVLTALHPPLESTGSCAQPLRIGPTSDDGTIETSAGLVFRDHERCETAGDAYEQRCVADRCTFVDPAARPFTLPSRGPLWGRDGACAAAVGRLRAIGGRLAATTHDEALATFTRWTAIAERGGRVWERRPDGAECDAVRVEPLEDEQTRLLLRRAEAAGTVEQDSVYRFRPLFRSATLVRASTHWTGPDGERAAGWGGRPLELGFYVGDGFVAAGTRVLFLRRAQCERPD